MAKSGKTSKQLANLASKILKNPKSTKNEKSLAGSVLSQAPNKSKSKKNKS